MMVPQQLGQMRPTGFPALAVCPHHDVRNRYRELQRLRRAGMHLVVQIQALIMVLHREFPSNSELSHWGRAARLASPLKNRTAWLR